MAISLEELKEGKQTKVNKAALLKNTSLRPWESHDQRDVSIRTIGAVEAVKKAKQIVQKNEEMIGELHTKMQEEQMGRVNNLLDTQQMRDRLEARLHATDQNVLKEKLVRSQTGDLRPPGIFNFIRHLFS